MPMMRCQFIWACGVFALAAGPVSAADPLPAGVEAVANPEIVSLADGSDSFSIQLDSRVGGVKGAIRILERSKNGDLSTLETLDSSDPKRVQVADDGRRLVLKSTSPISAGSTWVVDLSGASGCQPYPSAPPVRGLWKSTTGTLPPTVKNTYMIAQVCIPLPLVPVSPLVFSAPSAAAAVAGGAAVASSLPLILLGAAAAIGGVIAIITVNGNSGSGFSTSR